MTDIRHAAFIVEFSKDWNEHRAARASGIDPMQVHELLSKPEVDRCLQMLMEYRLERSHIDAEWLLMELVDNHGIARQSGNIGASNSALNLIAKHAGVDAFAAEKVEIASDEEIRARLLRARKRNCEDIPSNMDKHSDEIEGFL